jgi:hypothetical protein
LEKTNEAKLRYYENKYKINRDEVELEDIINTECVPASSVLSGKERKERIVEKMLEIGKERYLY